MIFLYEHLLVNPLSFRRYRFRKISVQIIIFYQLGPREFKWRESSNKLPSFLSRQSWMFAFCIQIPYMYILDECLYNLFAFPRFVISHPSFFNSKPIFMEIYILQLKRIQNVGPNRPLWDLIRKRHVVVYLTIKRINSTMF